MANIPEFRNSMKALTDLIELMPNEILHSELNSLSWHVTPYDYIAIKVVGSSEIHHHANIIFKGDRHIKIYFYTEADSDVADPYIANLHFSKDHDKVDIQKQIINILIDHGGFKIGE